MGCICVKIKEPLSLRFLKKDIFKQLNRKDIDTIDEKGIECFGQLNFAKLNKETLFKEVDFNKSVSITEEELMTF